MVFDRLGEGLVDVVEGEVALFLGVADQLADFFVDAAGHGGNALGGIGGGIRLAAEDGLNGFGLGGNGGLGFARHK